MPGVTSVHSDSEESNNVASKSKPKAVKGDAESDGEGGSEEEYEIEEVLDAKRGYFPDGRMGYYVSWKGYGPGDNSWVDEADAENAKDLVAEFWRKNPHKKKSGPVSAGRKSVDKKSPKKARKSAAADDASDVGETSTKKRGRKSVSQKPDSGEEMDVDEVQKPTKKARKTSTQPAKANAKKTKTPSPEVEEPVVGNMKHYMHLNDWEGLVKTVDTVELSGKKLVVFFTLQTGEAVMEASDVCKKRFPLKLLDFYEANLRWRQADAADSS